MEPLLRMRHFLKFHGTLAGMEEYSEDIHVQSLTVKPFLEHSRDKFSQKLKERRQDILASHSRFAQAISKAANFLVTQTDQVNEIITREEFDQRKSRYSRNEDWIRYIWQFLRGKSKITGDFWDYRRVLTEITFKSEPKETILIFFLFLFSL